MKILVFSWRDPVHPSSGGAEQVMHEYMKSWVRAGYEVVLFSSKVHGYLKSEEILDGVRIIRRSYQILGVQLAAFFWYVFGSRPKFDLIIDQFHGVPFFTPLYVRVPKLAVLQEVAREVWFKNHLPRPLNWIVGLIGYLIEPLVFLFYRRIPFMVGSNSAKEDLIKMGIDDKDITIVPHGVIIKKPKQVLPKEKIKTVCFLGALARDKGIEDAIKTFAILDRKDIFNFWVIGRGEEPYIIEIKSLVQRLGVKSKIKFWGYVGQQKKFELLARAHVMINPSIREGWGLVNIEANAMGTPVVAYRSPGLVDSVVHEKTGILTDQNTPSHLAQETIVLLKDSKRYARLQKGAVAWSRKFSWTKSKRDCMSLIQSVVQRK